MTPTESPLMVIGHKNPDTDSICSAISYAHYKREVAGVAAVPYRAGNLNPQTSFVLEHFGVAVPELVTTLQPRLSDIMIQGSDLLLLTEDDTVGTAQEIITQRRFAFLPVAGDGGKYVGKISALRLAGLLQDLAELGRKPEAVIRFKSFVGSIEGDVLRGETPDVFSGSVWLAGFGPVPSISNATRLAVVSGRIEPVPDADIIVVCAAEPGDQIPAALLEVRPPAS